MNAWARVMVLIFLVTTITTIIMIYRETGEYSGCPTGGFDWCAYKEANITIIAKGVGEYEYLGRMTPCRIKHDPPDDPPGTWVDGYYKKQDTEVCVYATYIEKMKKEFYWRFKHVDRIFIGFAIWLAIFVAISVSSYYCFIYWEKKINNAYRVPPTEPPEPETM